MALADVVAQHEQRAATSLQTLNWRTSLVDLLKTSISTAASLRSETLSTELKVQSPT
ncbi:DUF3597 family protein [Candidatus Fermentibacteria bacterium]|nr:DUF3597 family protein [Candidatus Fermentibacteria bacterium]